jgi:GAF domain-containing protein
VLAPEAAPAELPGTLAVQIAWDDEVRHVALLSRSTSRPWTGADVLIAETLGNQVALGLARLEADRRRLAQAGRDRALARAANALGVSLELQVVLDALAREACLAVGAAVSGVYLVDDDGTALATAGHNVPDEWFGYRLEPGAGIAGHVLQSGTTVTTSDYEGEMQLPRHVVLARGALGHRRADCLTTISPAPGSRSTSWSAAPAR